MATDDKSLDRLLLEFLLGGKEPATPRLCPENAHAIEQSWRTWVWTLFGPGTTTNLSAGFAPHHERAWEWFWNLRLGIYQPPFVFLLARGGAKSSTFEMGCAAVGARNTRKYALTISETLDQAQEHLGNIQTLLETPEIKAVYPNLGVRLENQYGTSRGWSAQKLRTKSGFSLMSLSLEKAARGIKQDGDRPDLVLPDDIDSEFDTKAAKDKKIAQITKKILAAGARSMTGAFGQNVITSRSIASDFVRGEFPFFTDAEVVGPIPAIRDLEVEENPDYTPGVSGSKKWLVLGGEPTWEGQDLQIAEQQINLWTLPVFLLEAQHEVSENIQGAIFPEWDETYHISTFSEFLAVYPDAGIVLDPEGGGQLLALPPTWDRSMSGDRGYTQGHPFAVGWFAAPTKPRYYEPDNTDLYHRYRELIAPLPEDGKDVKVNPLAVAREMVRLEKITGEWGADEQREIIKKRVFSHEGKGERNLFWQELSLDFAIADAGKTSGIADMKAFLSVNFDLPHPYRRYPADWPEAELRGEPIMGRPRFICLVPDDEGGLYTHRISEKRYRLAARPAKTSYGQARFRAEMPLYHWETSLDGTERQIPHKGMDDAIDQTRMAFGEGYAPDVRPLSKREQAEGLVATKFENLTRETISEIVDPAARQEAKAARRIALQDAIEHVEKKSLGNTRRPRLRKRLPGRSRPPSDDSPFS